jgi:hypothetical protein
MDKTTCCHDIIHSYCIKKRTLKTEGKLKIGSNSSHISRILSTLTLHRSFVRYQSSEFPPYLESLYNSLHLWYSKLHQISLQLSPNSEIDKLLPLVQTRISSSQRQLSTIKTLGSLVRLSHLSNRQKVEKVRYNVGIEGFLRWHLDWGQKSSFLRMLNFIQNRILAARPTSKSLNSQTVDHMNMCKWSLETWKRPLRFGYSAFRQIPFGTVRDLEFLIAIRGQVRFDIGNRNFILNAVSRFQYSPPHDISIGCYSLILSSF